MAASRNLDLHTLEAFDTLMRERNVSRAAEQLGISQSSASELLARLRERFGDPLLVRTAGGMAPTARAEELLPGVRAAIAQLRGLLEADAPFEPAAARERFRLTASDYAQLLLMPALSRTLLDAAPSSSVDVIAVSLRRIEQALDAAEADLAIAYHPEPPPGLRRSPLFTDRHVCIARQGHPAAHAGWTAAEFAALPHVNVAPSGLGYFGSAVDTALAAQGLGRRIAATSPHFLLAAYLVAQTDLILALPGRAAGALLSMLPLQVLALPMPTEAIELSMYWHERTHQSKAQRWLRETVRQILASGA